MDVGRTAGALVLASILAGGAARADETGLPPPTPPLADRGAVRAIVPGWTDFCSRYPRECAVEAGEPTVIRLTPEVWRAMGTVNRKVNNRVRGANDRTHYANHDRWDFPYDGRGDCEDYQVLKRSMLAREGLPRRAMRIAVVRLEGLGSHAVLVVRTDRGDFVLDNLTQFVRPWFQTGYVYRYMESQDRLGWVSLGDARALTGPATPAPAPSAPSSPAAKPREPGPGPRW